MAVLCWLWASIPGHSGTCLSGWLVLVSPKAAVLQSRSKASLCSVGNQNAASTTEKILITSSTQKGGRKCSRVIASRTRSRSALPQLPQMPPWRHQAGKTAFSLKSAFSELAAGQHGELAGWHALLWLTQTPACYPFTCVSTKRCFFFLPVPQSSWICQFCCCCRAILIFLFFSFGPVFSTRWPELCRLYLKWRSLHVLFSHSYTSCTRGWVSIGQQMS